MDEAFVIFLFTAGMIGVISLIICLLTDIFNNRYKVKLYTPYYNQMFNI